MVNNYAKVVGAGIGAIGGYRSRIHYRLETGAKEAPSDETLNKLSRALKAGKRENEMLRYVATHPETDALFVLHVLNDASVTYEEFATAASASYRGSARPDYVKLIERVRKILAED